jgi:nucleotide-binding universal stress UspA family protein
MTLAARRVVLAIGGLTDVAAGVRAVAAAAAAPGSRVMVVHLAQALVGAPGFTSLESAAEIKKTMVKAISFLDAAGIEALGTVVRTGPGAQTLDQIATSWNADVIVTGFGRMRDARSILLGSVTPDLFRVPSRSAPVAKVVRS